VDLRTITQGGSFMKRFVFALLLGAAVVASAAPALAESQIPRPEGLQESWVVVTDPSEIGLEENDRK